jgi:uncharacterized glyoxalase superfamily protein PhnB
VRVDIPGIVMTGSLNLHVSNIDERWGSLKDQAEVMFPPQDMAYRMRECGIKDPNGDALILGEDISKT